MSPLVSILIPAYNSQRWIADTIQSALAQTWSRTEIIVVDDGSRDATLPVARQFESSRVKVLTQPNQGAAAARNTAYSVCQGDYIQWLDADDLLAPEKIECQMAFVDAGGDRRTLFSGPWGYFVRRPQRAQFTPTSLWHDLSPLEFMLRKLGQNLSMQTATWLTARGLAEAAGGWDGRLLGDDDGEYFSRVVLACDGIWFVPGAKVYYRRVPGSLSQLGGSERKLAAQLLSLQLGVKYIRSMEDSPRVREACLSLLNTWYIHYFPEWPEMVAELERLAASLGGRLNPPRMSWKYAWIQKTLGWTTAKRVQAFYNGWKWRVIGSLDQAALVCEQFSGRRRRGGSLVL